MKPSQDGIEFPCKPAFNIMRKILLLTCLILIGCTSTQEQPEKASTMRKIGKAAKDTGEWMKSVGRNVQTDAKGLGKSVW